MGDPDVEESPCKRVRLTYMFRSCCQRLVRHVVGICDEEKSLGMLHFGLARSRERAVDYLGISRQSILRLLDENTTLLDPGEAEERDRGMMMTEEDARLIRPALVSLVLERKTVTLSSLLERIKKDNPSWIWSRATLQRALNNRCGIHFTRRKHDYYQRLREDPDNIQRRALYLKFFFQYETEGRYFAYMDETWINQNLVPTKCWTDGTSDCEADVPPGKGPRWIVIGAGGESGWIPNTFSMWKGNVLSEDYHSEMNGEVYQQWFCTRLLPNLPPNACVVIDRAPYHTLLTAESKGARSTFNRPQLASWLVSHHATDEDGHILSEEELLSVETVTPAEGGGTRKRKGWSKQALYALAQSMKPRPQYMVHEWAKRFNVEHGTNITVLILPVAHPALNPIELIWTQLKQFVRQSNHEHDMAKIRELALQKQAQLGADAWKAVCEHSRRYAVEQWRADELILIDDEATADPEETDEGDLEE